MKLEMLRVFQTTAAHGSLARAAEALGRTPSAVSMMLLQLEQEVGGALFEAGRKSRLTPLGLLVLEESRRANEAFERSVGAIRRYATATGGLVRIAAVPLLAAEFPEACLEYPIVFTQGQDGQWMALALTGLQAGANAFVDAKGQWSARYVPASVRRYPFILAEGANQQLSLAADLSAPQLGTDGDALFDDQGEPTALTRNIMNLLADFQNQATATAAMVQKLHEAQLLTQQNLQVKLGDERSAVVEGVWIVDEAKLRQLPDDKVLAWFKDGALAAIHAQMLSLRNLLPLLQRSQPGKTSDKPGKKAKGS